MSNANSPSDSQQRLVALEERLTFFEQHVEQLNEVLLAQSKEIGELRRQLSHSRTAIERLSESVEGGDLPHEKPPHY